MIKIIKLLNCQSWKEGVIPLAQNSVNVLKADNNSGKSVLFKMLKMTVCPNYYTPKERKKLIRNGCESADIIYLFTDNSIGICRVFPTRVLYMFAQDGEHFESYQNPPQEMIDNLGIVHNADRFIANIIDMDQSLLLVDSNVYENYELIKLLTENLELNELKLKLQNNLGEFEEKSRDLVIEQVTLNELLSEVAYRDVDKMQAELDLAQNWFDTLEVLDSVETSLNRLNNNWVDSIDFDSLTEQMKTLESLTKLSALTKNIVFRKEITQAMVDFMDFFISISNSLAKLKTAENKDYDFVKQQLDIVEYLQKILNVLQSIKIPVEKNYNNLIFQINSLTMCQRLENKLLSIQHQESQKILSADSSYRVLQFVERLENLSNAITITENDFQAEQIQLRTLQFLNKLKTLLSTVSIPKSIGECNDLIDTLTVLNSLAQHSKQIAKNLNLSENCKNTINSLQIEIEKNGTVIECPHFGKVLFNGQECLHGVLENN